MKIKSNASPDEMTSPYFKLNKEFCMDFESYISKNNGKVKGHYNAWSYLIFGKINTPKNWTLTYKKSTFSSTGNLFISSKKQCLLVLSEWKTERSGTHNSEFRIRKKKPIDFLRKIINRSISELDISDKYILEVKENKSKLISQLTEILKPLFYSKEIYQIDHKNNALKIEMRTEKHHFDIFNTLTKEI